MMSDGENGSASKSEPTWTYFSNHAHVMFCLTHEPDARLRDVAAIVGITERAVQKIVADLEREEVLYRSREGRRNHYRINPAAKMRHNVEKHVTVGDLLRLVLGDEELAELGIEVPKHD